MTKTNRSDVDRLGDVRAEIKELQAEEDVLRQRILETELAMIDGDDYVAVIDPRERRTLDTRAVIAWYGEKELERFFRSSSYTTVFINPRKSRAKGKTA